MRSVTSRALVDWYHAAMREGHVLVDASVVPGGETRNLRSFDASRPATIGVVRRNRFWKFNLTMKGNHLQVVDDAERIATEIGRAMFPGCRCYSDRLTNQSRELGIHWVPREKLWIFQKLWGSHLMQGKIIFLERYPCRGFIVLESASK